MLFSYCLRKSVRLPMYRSGRDQLEFVNFIHPFGGRLQSNNRWIILSKLIPWDLVEEAYQRSFPDTSVGAPAISARIAFGALVIKERLGITDRETVQQITENPYLQCFLGLVFYQESPIFHHTMMVYFRSRFSQQDLSKINERIALGESSIDPNADDQSSDMLKNFTKYSPSSDCDSLNSKVSSVSSSDSVRKNHGKLLVDATCTPADITFPTDIKLLNEAREKTEHIIDLLHADIRATTLKPIIKPRDYRQKARKDFLSIIKIKRPGRRKIRTAIGKQIRYLKRNLQHIDRLIESGASLSSLTNYEHKNLMVIHTLYEQQRKMYFNKTHRVADRIVSISQPHIRPIVRGKASAPVEFGAKISISYVNGFTYLDRLSWDAYNECNDLESQIEAYHRRHGYYPASVHADNIYRTRSNRTYCNERNIRLSGIRPGSLPKNLAIQKALLDQVRDDEISRIPVEGKFGNVKRGGTLQRVMAKLSHTAECVIHFGFIVLNLNSKLRKVFYVFFTNLLYHFLSEFISALRTSRGFYKSASFQIA